jgi:hypothetical protein
MGRVTHSAHLATTISQGTDKTKALENTIAIGTTGEGAPSSTLGTDGNFYFRKDGGAFTTIYQKRSGIWVGIV